ncbi:hypothetical protein ABPG74_010549 [Tetrahymena malaccensis]
MNQQMNTNLPYIGSSRNIPIQAQHNIINLQDDKLNQNSVNNRRKLYVQKYPKNLDSKLMTDILGGPLIEEIPKDPPIRRPRSQSKKQLNDRTNNLSLDQNSIMGDNDRMNKNSMSFHVPQSKDNNSLLEKAMLENDIQELREKLYRQDRNINTMNDLVKSLESKLQTRQQLQDSDIQQILTANKSQLNAYEQKIRDLELKIQSDQRQYDDIKKNLQQNDQNQKEILNFIRNMQKEESNQIMNMKGLIQDKLTEENNNLSKEKAKTKALFMEVVRLGENQERQSNSMKQTQQDLEEKIRFLESKIMNGERTVSQLAEKGDKNINQMGEWGEVTAQRIRDFENGLQNLQRELVKEKQNIRNIEEINNRTEQEVRNQLKLMKSDITDMNENYFSQISQKLYQEREERNKILEELQMSIDQKQRIMADKVNFDKQELKEKVGYVEQLLKQESIKNSEGLLQIQGQQDQQLRYLQEQLKAFENNQINQDNKLKQDILKIQEQFNKDYLQYKNYQNGLTEKITEMMQQEIKTRINSDIDLKNLTSDIAQDIVSDINKLKDGIESQFKEVYDEIKNMNSECAQRCSKLSIFTEQECSNLGSEFIKKFDKLKDMFTKLAEQFKSHLIHYDTNRNSILQKIEFVDAKYSNLGSDLLLALQDQQKNFQEKVESEIKLLDEEVNGVKIQTQDRCIKIEQEQLKDIELIKEAIQDLTGTLNDKIDKTQKQNDLILQNNDDKLQEVLLNTQKIKDQIQIFDERINQLQEQNVTGASYSISQLQSEINLIVQNQNSINTQFQVDLDQLTQNINTADQNRQNQIQELVEYSSNFEGEMAIKIQSLEESVLNNLKIVNQTIQTIESLQSTFDDNMISLQAEMTLEKTMNKTEFENLKQDINDLINIFEKANQKQYKENDENNDKRKEEELNQLKNEMQEKYERKLQQVLENIKRENQELWKQSLEQINSNYSGLIDKEDYNNKNKSNQIPNKSDITFQTRLNEILLTQDTYNKPYLKQKK